jgi:hypothetical protein
MIPLPSDDSEAQPRQAGHIHRRDFLMNGIKVTASLFVLDWMRVPAFAARAGKLATGPMPPKVDDSIGMLADYMTRYTVPQGNFPATGGWKATYDLIGWIGEPGPHVPPHNPPVGQLVITRKGDASGGKIGYDIDYVIHMNGWDTGLKSTMECSADRLPRLLKWQTHYENHSVNDPGRSWALTEQGECKEGVMEIVSKAGTRRFQTALPVAPQWAVIDALRGAKADPADPIAGARYDMLHNLTSYRPGQTIKPCGVLDMTIGGQPYQFHGFIQTGHGNEPTHFWVDSAGRPLLTTGGLRASALTSIQAA